MASFLGRCGTLLRILRIALILVLSATSLLASPPALKEPITGLISMGNIEFHRHDGGVPDNSLAEVEAKPDVFCGVVINATWAQLEPSPDQFDFAAIDKDLVAIRDYNARHGAHPLGAKLRVWSGPNDPVWVKQLGGAPIPIVHIAATVVHTELPLTIGRFWTPSYRGEWKKMMDHLAKRYDDEGLIRVVSNTSCSTITNEPFLISSDTASLEHLHKAGLTDARYQQCLENSVGEYAGWKTTRLDYAINPFRRMDSGTPRADMPFTLRVMALWQKRYGEQAILMNCAYDDPLEPRFNPIFAEMKRLHAQVDLQMFSPNSTHWDGAVSNAPTHGATALELWPKAGRFTGFSDESVETLKRWSNLLKKPT